MKQSFVQKRPRVRSRFSLKWNRNSNFSDVVAVVAQLLQSGHFRQIDLHSFLEENRVYLPWDRCDAQIQESLVLFDDELQFDIQRSLYASLQRAYEGHYPDCGGTRGVMLMLALMKCLTSLEVSLGVDFSAQRATASADPFWHG